MRRIAFRLASAGSVAAAVYHLAALLVPSFAALAYPPDYPGVRHVVFASIDGSLGWLLLRRPRWLVWPYTLMTIQVLNGHGRGAWSLWRAQGRIDWISVGVSVGVPVVLLLLVLDRRAQA